MSYFKIDASDLTNSKLTKALLKPFGITEDSLIMLFRKGLTLDDVTPILMHNNSVTKAQVFAFTVVIEMLKQEYINKHLFERGKWRWSDIEKYERQQARKNINIIKGIHYTHALEYASSSDNSLFHRVKETLLPFLSGLKTVRENNEILRAIPITDPNITESSYDESSSYISVVPNNINTKAKDFTNELFQWIFSSDRSMSPTSQVYHEYARQF